MKRFLLGISLAAAAIFAVQPAFAYDFQAGDLCYNYLSKDNKTVEVTYLDTTVGGNAEYVSGDIEIPSVVNYEGADYTVASVGEYAFHDCIYITSAKLPASVKTIDTDAFYFCTGMTSVVMEEVESIGEYAFHGCRTLADVTFADVTTTIMTNAFQGCFGLKEVNIPASVTYIAPIAFYNCRVDKFTVDAQNANYASLDGALYNKDITTLLVCPNNSTEFTLPATVTTIGMSAFKECTSMATVNFNDKLEVIEKGAFESCVKLTSVELPATLTRIDSEAFSLCTSLEDVKLPMTLGHIGSQAFSACRAIKEITLPDALTELSDSILSGTSISEIVIPKSVVVIGNGALRNTYLASIDVPEGVTTIKDYAFERCTSLKTITLPSTLETLGNNVFNRDTRVKEVTCRAIVPPVCQSKTWNYDITAYATLYIPTESVDAYKAATGWSSFKKVEAKEFSGVDSVISDDNSLIEVNGDEIAANGNVYFEVYTISGVKIYAGTDACRPGKGLYIIKAGDTTAKVLIK